MHKHNGSFMSYQLNAKRKYDIAKVAQGVSVVHLYGEHLKGVNTYNPCIEEQKKIARLLSLLDERIATQNKIIEDLKKLNLRLLKNYTQKSKAKNTRMDNYLRLSMNATNKWNIPISLLQAKKKVW